MEDVPQDIPDAMPKAIEAILSGELRSKWQKMDENRKKGRGVDQKDWEDFNAALFEILGKNLPWANACDINPDGKSVTFFVVKD